jgi:hypothetical protein
MRGGIARLAVLIHLKRPSRDLLVRRRLGDRWDAPTTRPRGRPARDFAEEHARAAVGALE